MICTELLVNRSDLRSTHIHQHTLDTLAPNCIRVAIDKFALTANNVTYAVTGDMIGYWGFFPAESPWGKVPVWGCANIVESNCSQLSVGERLWGFFPMATHLDLEPAAIKSDSFVDAAAYRQPLPPLYNAYRRTAAEPKELQAMENERSLLFPLFMTSYVLSDFLIDNDLFGAEQVVIGSVSSKTGFGLAAMLHKALRGRAKVIGVTSPANVDFVTALHACDQVVTYDTVDQIDSALKTAYVDMSGNAQLTRGLHNRFADKLVHSSMVGATHWEARGDLQDLPGAKPTLFFAPAQIAKRNDDWGPGVVMHKATAASVELAQRVAPSLSIEWTYSALDLQRLWLEMLDNRVAPSSANMVSLHE